MKRFNKMFFGSKMIKKTNYYDSIEYEHHLFYDGDLIGVRYNRKFTAKYSQRADTVKANNGDIFDLVRYGPEKLLLWLLARTESQAEQS